MRRSRCRGSLWGCVSILAGVMILLALILPAVFWWFAIGSGLIGFGLFLNNRCC